MVFQFIFYDFNIKFQNYKNKTLEKNQFNIFSVKQKILQFFFFLSCYQTMLLSTEGVNNHKKINWEEEEDIRTKRRREQEKIKSKEA